MAHKFTIQGGIPEVKNPDQPVLFYVHIASMYFLHKGKKLDDSVNNFLASIDRALRGLKYDDPIKDAVAYCKKHPGINKVSVELVMNAAPGTILAKEAAMLKQLKKDPSSLNNPDVDQYKPEWMLKEVYHKRCEGDCVGSGIVDGKKMKFRFCPNCGHIPK